MSKNNFLLLDLEDERAKDIASAVSSKTSKKILKYLGENEDATETNLSLKLKVPISTIHYNLEQLKKAGLVDWKKYHYSEKGKEVRHYSLTNKYIIITPKNKDNSFLDQLKNIIPTFLFSLVAVWIFSLLNDSKNSLQLETYSIAKARAYDESAQLYATSGTSLVKKAIPEIYLYFILGVIFALTTYLIINYIRKNHFKKN